jgi:hypothetical protein
MPSRALALLLLFAFGAAAQIPLPNGPFGIGRIGYHWVDTTRHDTDAADPKAPRELMVYVWYPAEKAASARGAYLPGAAQMDAMPDVQARMRRAYGATWAAVLSGDIASHAVERAAPAPAPRQFPAIVFSHGLGMSGFSYTVLIEELVSRGYVVAAIEHTYAARAVWFPDGRVIMVRDALRGGPPKGAGGSYAAGINDGAADVRFVIDRLTAKGGPEWPLAGRIDAGRIAAMGHSAGAEFSARACQLDARIHACVDLDGGMVPVAALPLYDDHPMVLSPLLLLEAYHAESTMGGLSHERIAEYYKVREQQLQSCPRGTYAVVLDTPGIAHASFADDPVLFAGQKEYPPLEAALHNLDLIARFTAEFLGKSFRQEKAPLFEGGAPAEAKVVAYGR